MIAQTLDAQELREDCVTRLKSMTYDLKIIRKNCETKVDAIRTLFDIHAMKKITGLTREKFEAAIDQGFEMLVSVGGMREPLFLRFVSSEGFVLERLSAHRAEDTVWGRELAYVERGRRCLDSSDWNVVRRLIVLRLEQFHGEEVEII